MKVVLTVLVLFAFVFGAFSWHDQHYESMLNYFDSHPELLEDPQLDPEVFRTIENVRNVRKRAAYRAELPEPIIAHGTPKVSVADARTGVTRDSDDDDADNSIFGGVTAPPIVGGYPLQCRQWTTIDRTAVGSYNWALFSAMGNLNATASNYLQYNSTTSIFVSTGFTVQQKWWDDANNRYIDTYQAYTPGTGWGTPAYYYTWPDLLSFTDQYAGARSCSTSNDTTLYAYACASVTVTPMVQETIWVNATSGALFASEQLTTTNPDPNNYQRDITFKTYLSTGTIYVTQITQFRVQAAAGSDKIIPTNGGAPPALLGPNPSTVCFSNPSG